MQVLDVNGFDDASQPVPRRVVAVLEAGHHSVALVTVGRAGFDTPMSTAERMAYHDVGHNVLAAEIAESVDMVRASNALVFCSSVSHSVSTVPWCADAPSCLSTPTTPT